MHRTLASLTAWMPAQRWFTATSTGPELRILAVHDLPGDDSAARARVVVVVDEAPARPIIYQVPLVERRQAAPADPDFLIGTGDDGALLIDGPHDDAYTSALLTALGLPPDEAQAAVLAGEQSNTSIIFRWPALPPVICKVFRQLSAGLNPDIELQSALVGAGSPHVPGVVGRIDGSWSPLTQNAMTETGSFAFAQDFLPGVEDAWRVALRAAAASASFTDDAEGLGRVTAEVHRDLARALPTAPADEDAQSRIAAAWARRLAIAIDEVPALRGQRPAIEAVYAAAMRGPWPRLQRIHGDFHLGQVLSAPGRGWVVLDFEGEPMRPIAERRAPDLALRDIAGMLRSFDYVAGSLQLEDPSHTAGAWARAARAAFLRGYREGAEREPTGVLLDALELDKAVYEAIYEARHRPQWVQIPLSAIHRLAAR